jgi:hypothetical protein
MDRARPPTKPFRFLNLPKELRLVVYDHLPRIIEHIAISSVWDSPDGVVEEDPFTLIHRRTRTSTSLLCTSKTIYAEAAPILHRALRDFILDASPKMLSDKSTEGLHPAGSIMRAAACDFDHLRQRFGFSRDGSPENLVPSHKDLSNNTCLYLAVRCCNYDNKELGQHTPPGSPVDYTRNIPLFLKHLTEARETTSTWDYDDMWPQVPPECGNSEIFLPGSRKAQTPTIRHKDPADKNGIRHAVKAWITTTSIQLLYHHIKRIQASYLGNPLIEHISYYRRNVTLHTISAEDRAYEYIQDALDNFLRPQGSVCYDFGVDVAIVGHVVVANKLYPLDRKAVFESRVSDIHRERLRTGQPEPRGGLGRVAFLPALTSEEWERDWTAGGC